MKYSLYQESRKGGRKSNQDRLGHAYTSEAILLILADGMGGHARGDVAAQILIDVVLGMFHKTAQPALADPLQFLLDGIYTAHETINDYASEHGLADSPRSTCIACVVQGDRAYWAHVGDSRLYHFSRDGLVSRTRDHSTVQELLDEGAITEDQVNNHPDRNKLYTSVGGFNLPNIELSAGVKLQDGDILLLSSDGFWSEFRPEEMLATLRVYPLKQGLVNLLDHAEFRAGTGGDNLSVMGLRCGEDRQDVSTWSDLGLDGFTTELKELAGEKGGSQPTMTDLEIDKAIDEIRTALLKHNLDK